MQRDELKRAVERLDILISLLIPPFDELKYQVSGLALEILKSCDGEHSASEIADELKKPKNAIEKSLTKLRRLGLMKSIIKDGRTYYIRLK